MFLIRSPRTPQKMKHLRGLVRAFAYLAVTMLVFSAWSIRSARAEMQNRTIVLGREMLLLANASQHDVTPIVFNEQKMFLGSSISNDAPSAVLDRYEAHCKASPGQPAAGWKDIDPRAAASAPEIATTGLMRSGSAEEGTVICFVKGADTKATASEAFRSFAETGELGALGRLRYVYAKATKSGRTHVLTAWTDDRFNLVDMMPEEGKDAPGQDFPELPRVPNSTRALSAYAEGMPYGVNVYKTTDAPGTTLAFYDAQMIARGFHGFDPELTEEKNGGQGRAYVKDGVVLTIGTKVQPEGVFVALGLAGVADHGSPRSELPDAP